MLLVELGRDGNSGSLRVLAGIPDPPVEVLRTISVREALKRADTFFTSPAANIDLKLLIDLRDGVVHAAFDEAVEERLLVALRTPVEIPTREAGVTPIAWTHHRVLSFLAGSITFWANCTHRRVDGFTPSTPSTPNIQHTLGSATPISAFIWRCRCNIRHCRNSEMSSNGPPGTWETTELIGVLALGQFLVLSEDAHCHHVVQAVAPIPIRT